MSGQSSLDPDHLIAPPKLPLTGDVYLILTAAGSSSRFGDTKKELQLLGGASVLQRSLEAFLGGERLAGVIITYPEGRLGELRSALEPLLADGGSALPRAISFVQGGRSRQDSVEKGLKAIMSAAADPANAVVLVHDAARPWVSADTIGAVLASARKRGACVPLADLPDTPKEIGSGGFISAHPWRDSLKAAQTPQGFALATLAEAYAAAAADGWVGTDDSSLWDRYVGKVAYIPGDRNNRKITYREDLPMTERRSKVSRIGEGWDIHPLVPSRKLLIGGIHLAHDKGEAGHSDGDVLWHAITDALLGAASLGDIGSHFPPSDARWKDADSGGLAKLASDLVAAEGWAVGNIDCTVILETPRLGPYREAIRANIARVLDIPGANVSVKAKTNEGFGEIGAGNAIEARAIVLLVEKSCPRASRD